MVLLAVPHTDTQPPQGPHSHSHTPPPHPEAKPFTGGKTLSRNRLFALSYAAPSRTAYIVVIEVCVMRLLYLGTSGYRALTTHIERLTRKGSPFTNASLTGPPER